MNESKSSFLQSKLEALGLLPKEAKIYLTLLGIGEMSMALLATRAGLKRPTTYEICKRLVQRNLVTIYERDKKQMVQPQSPENLRDLARTHAETADQVRQEVESELATLKQEYDSARLRPTIRYLVGEDSIRETQNDTLEVGEDIYLVRTIADSKYSSLVHDYIKKRIKKGIRLIAVTPDVSSANRDSKKDQEWLFDRRWIKAGEYQSPIQIQVYGNRIAFINFSDRNMGIIIEDKNIAQAMREILSALRNRLPDKLKD